MSRSGSRLLLAAALCALAGLVIASAGGVRGSDQFWYVAEVESIARGDGAVTNTIYPNPLLRRQAAPPYRPIHHNPLLYLVAPLAGLIGGYAAWLACNLACAVAIALLLRALLLPRVGETPANLAAAVFAVLPATFWQASQPLADAWIALLVMLCIWSLCRAGEAAWRWPVTWACLLTAALCREFFALPLLLLPGLYLLWSEGRLRRRVGWAVAMLAGAALALAAKGPLFPQQLEFSPAAAWRQLATRAPDMFLYFDLESAPRASLGELLWSAAHRLARALREHLLPPWRQTVFNALALVAMSGWSARRRAGMPPRLLPILTGLLLLHLVVITTQHASFRYCFVITAPLMVAAVVVLAPRLRPAGLGLWLWAAVLVGSLAVDLALAEKNRREGRAVGRLVAASREALGGVVGPGEAVAFEAVGLGPGIWYLWAGHALPESPVIYLDPDFPYDQETYDRLRRQSGATWLICRRESPLRADLRADAEPVASLPAPAAGWEVYRLPRPGPPAGG